MTSTAAEPVFDEFNAGVNAAEIGADSAIPAEELERLTADIITALKSVYDPEIPADIYELGLIYKIDIDDDRNIAIEMTLTAPGCPVAGEMPAGWKTPFRSSPAWQRSTCASSSIRRGTRAACRTRRASRSTGSDFCNA